MRYFVSCGGALSTGCDYVPHSSFGCVPPLDASPLASGGRPPKLKPSSEGLGLSPVAPKRGKPTGSEAFLELPVALGFGPVTGPALKTALCHIRTLVGRKINNGTFFVELIRGKESYVIRGRIRLTATSSGRFNTLFFYTVLFKGYERSPSAGRSISNWLWMTSWNRRPWGKHEEDSLRPASLDHRSVPLVRSAAQR